MKSAVAFELANALWICRVRALLGLAFGKVRQSVFNQKSLQTRDRMALLRLLVEETMNDRQVRFTDFAVMTRLYGPRWIYHPLKKQRSAYYGLLLDSLLVDGLLGKDQHQYVLAPKALVALSAYEDEERRHIDNKKIQRRIVWLTVISAIAAMFQAWPVISSFLAIDITVGREAAGTRREFISHVNKRQSVSFPPGQQAGIGN
ncbi:hypothetical protein [Burkholderia gladioli]|uniref:hypothetical protein n=1 Tax=Burkholderia gladioli TaxID=28095 RepID=UPI001641021F|nr:hypothetical protein [Burkholderia gladioli]